MSTDIFREFLLVMNGNTVFPKKKLAGGIPVLWFINNENVDPPWGKVARIEI